ncbi:MAG: Deoxycytidine triphosphate deaminase [Microgenomates group bacterium GW2011_GWF2_45_18]|nr:MAG: Deoxycytidine triphosphate deaminase [Microgenomates group bacterium GW2011_GWF1_44_10]KKU01368.1 MAG: Deoxycytidine triphosphate deaminase [Microgenomates group bacterium GW2011_GWF2_45_18]HAU98624.1 dCTP deaminase [Candidatus Paceibacterota bacterium]HAX01206.1 dCTP deaminase [Candidatus Paceibacterota bacterium]
MVLSDKDIRAYIDQKKLQLSPFDPTHVRTAAIDLTLHQNFRVFRNSAHTHIDVKKEFDVTDLVHAKEDGSFIIHPREFVLGSTREIITLPNDLIGLLEGRSSLGRIGIIVHATASFVQPGFSGYLTFEMSNISNLPIKLYAGMCVAQIAFLQMSSPVELDYSKRNSKYQDQEPPTPSKIWKDFE